MVSKQSLMWWQSGVIYQIYVRSFCDSNGDGIGDLPGVMSKLDYIAQLGVDAIWLSPVTASANADWGYDVTDYYAIDPALGTMADFERLLREAKKRKLKVLTDFVPNHTSIHHPWFKSASQSRTSPYRDWYIWSDPRLGGLKPTNWKSSFGGSAWKYQAATGQYYLHNFLPEQADLNWRNPKVVAEFDKIMRFWLDKGVDGFRIDVFNMLIKDREFRDNPKSDKADGYEVRLLGQKPLYTTSRPEIHAILRRWRRLADSYAQPKLLLGETTLVYDPRQLATFYGQHNELELAFNFRFLQSPLKASIMRQVVEETNAAVIAPDWPVWAMSNHDQPRAATRWGRNHEDRIRCSLLLLLALKGTPVLYYGDELGMPDARIPRFAMKDPFGKRLWPFYNGRDRARTPMIWSHLRGYGFTDSGVKPWLPFGPSGRSVAAQQLEADTTLQFTRAVLDLRRKHPELAAGEHRTVVGDDDIWVWRRGDDFVVAVNLSSRSRTVTVGQGIVRLATLRSREGETVAGNITLAGWQGVIVELA